MFIDNYTKNGLVWDNYRSKHRLEQAERDIETLTKKLHALEKHLGVEYFATTEHKEGYRECSKSPSEKPTAKRKPGRPRKQK